MSDTPLDPARFQELFDDFGEDAADVIGEFAAEARRDLDALHEAVAAGDADSARALAHRLKGGCMLVGATVLQAAASTVEARAREGATGDELRAATVTLDAAWARTEAALEPHLRRG